MAKDQLTHVEALRIALAAQGFSNQSRDKPVTWRHIAKAIDQLHLLQIDSVNVLTRSHYLPLFSRLGDYDRATLDKHSLAKTNRQVFECWAHEASFVPMQLHPLMRWRMNRARNGNGKYKGMNQFAKQNKAFLKSTLEHIRKNGPTTASAIPGSGKSQGGWWGWSKGKSTVECLFDQGHITASHRDGFERIYDVTERVIPADVLNAPTPDEPETFRRLVLLAAQALGISTADELRDYFRTPIAESRAALRELLSAKALLEVNVTGWKKPAYILPETKVPRKAGGTALLSPFDPLVWNRERAERLFNFHYRIEIYTPQHKRKFGYYVLPFLNGDRLVGRACLKADRETSTLRANQLHLEDLADQGETAAALARELHLMKKWLGLNNVEAKGAGALAKAVSRLL